MWRVSLVIFVLYSSYSSELFCKLFSEFRKVFRNQRDKAHWKTLGNRIAPSSFILHIHNCSFLVIAAIFSNNFKMFMLLPYRNRFKAVSFSNILHKYASFTKKSDLAKYLEFPLTFCRVLSISRCTLNARNKTDSLFAI